MKLSEVFRAYKEGREGLPLSETARVTEFASFLARGLRTDLMDQYLKYVGPVEFEFTTKPSDGAYETYPKISSVEGMGERLAGGEFPRMAFTSEDVRLINKEYGGICEVDQFLIDTDQTNKIRGLAGTAGEIAGRAKHKIAYDLLNAGHTTTCYDASYIFATTATGHPNVTGGSTSSNNDNFPDEGTLSESTYEAVLGHLSLFRGIYGEALNIKPIAIITGTSDMFTAQRLFKDPVRLPAAATTYGHAKNIFYNTIEVYYDKMLTADSWYVKTDVTGFIHQQLTPLEVSREPADSGLSFDTRVWRFRLYEAFVLGVIDWRTFVKGN